MEGSVEGRYGEHEYRPWSLTGFGLDGFLKLYVLQSPHQENRDVRGLYLAGGVVASNERSCKVLRTTPDTEGLCEYCFL